jgi:hypothetical protein
MPTIEFEKLYPGHRLIVQTGFSAGRASHLAGDHLRVLSRDGSVSLLVRSMRTGTAQTIAANAFVTRCANIGFDGLEAITFSGR